MNPPRRFFFLLPAGRFRGVRPALACSLLAALLLPATARAAGRALVVSARVEYPPIAKRLGITGRTVLEVTVAADGTVKQVGVLAGQRVLTDPVKEAVLKWKYAPAEAESKERVELDFH